MRQRKLSEVAIIQDRPLEKLEELQGEMNTKGLEEREIEVSEMQKNRVDMGGNPRENIQILADSSQDLSDNKTRTFGKISNQNLMVLLLLIL